MNIYVKAKGLLDVEPSGQYSVAGNVDIAIEVMLFNFDIAADTDINQSNSDSYPGKEQFLKDVENILVNCGDIVLHKHASNVNNSPSIYLVTEHPLTESRSVICNIHLRISNHRNLESEFDGRHDKYLNKIVKLYKSVGSVGFEDYEIIVEMEVHTGYQNVLTEIDNKFNDIARSLSYTYKRKIMDMTEKHSGGIEND